MFRNLTFTGTGKALGLAIALATGSALLPITAQAEDNITNSTQSSQRYNIPAGPLTQVLNQFASQAGIALSFDASQLAGVQSLGLSGSYTVEQGFKQLLSDTGQTALRQGNGDYVVEVISTNMLEPVSVNADVTQVGSVQDGYISSGTGNIGPWQALQLQDTPYSINVTSREQIENVQATTSPDQLFKMNPVTQLTWPQHQNDYPRVFLRGFQNSSSIRNGVNMPTYVHGLIMEEVERIEVLTGLSGFLYGSGNVGGLVHYVTKQPTEDRLNSVSVGNTTGTNGYLHGDFGGQFDKKGTFGYRINLVTQNGQTYVDHQSIERNSVSAAFDWQATDNLLIDINLSRRDYLNHGRLPYWSLASGVTRPDADHIDPSKNWGQKWTEHKMETQRAEIGFNWQANDNITVRSRFVNESNKRSSISASNTIQADNTYNQRVNDGTVQELASNAGYTFVDIGLDTFSIQHKLTLGGQISEASSYTEGETVPDAVTFTGFNLDNPTYVSPSWTSHRVVDDYKNYKFGDRTLTIGDHITLNENWSVLAGISHTRPFIKRYDSTGNRTATYKKGAYTPTLSIIYKPTENITTYASYIEGLERGGTAGETYGSYDVVNKNEVMDPLTSKQLELGAKANVAGVLITGAIYEIDKPLEYYQELNSTQVEFVQDGRQVHRGAEFTATGSLTDRTRIIGGFSLLDAKIRDNKQTPALEGKTPGNVAEEMYKLYVEYDLPSLPGATVNGGASYTGDFYGDNENTDKIDGHALANIGARYHTKIAEKPVSVRLNINNILDTRYWANSSFLGDGRTFSLSGKVQF